MRERNVFIRLIMKAAPNLAPNMGREMRGTAPWRRVGGECYLLKRSFNPSRSKPRVKRRVWSRGFDFAVAMR